MDWEQTKENAVPVRQGRSKAALQELADETGTLEAKRRDLWAEVVNYQGDDPLDAWQRYIKWMQEYGVGGGKADLQKVLEACTRELLKYPRYTGDIRFLRIWIQYADCLPDPADVFLFLREKGIGRDFALYYEAYATYFELKGNFQNADAVYMDGVQRGAKPLERLKQKHGAFQQRMAQRIQRRIQDEQVMGPPPAEPVRSSLATLNVRGGGRPNALAQQQQSIFGAAAPASLFGSRMGQQELPQQKPRGLQPAVGILADDEFADGENAVPGLPGYCSMPQVNNLRELKPYGVIRKENLDRPAAWNQAPLLPGMGAPAPGGGTAGGAASSSLDIFVDEEFEEAENHRSCLPAGKQAAAIAGPSGDAAGPSLFHALLPAAALGEAGAGPAARLGPLMSSLAPPPALLLGGQPGAAKATSATITALPAAHAAHTATAAKELHGTLAASSAPTITQLGAAVSAAQAAAGPCEMPQRSRLAAPAAETSGDGEPSALQDGSDDEVSYEELRALAWFRKNPSYLSAGTPAVADENPMRAGGVSHRQGSSGSGMPASAPRRALGQIATDGAPCPASTSGCLAGTQGTGPVGSQGQGAAPPPRRMPFGQVAAQTAAAVHAGNASTSSSPGDSPSFRRRAETEAGGEPKRRPLAEAGPSSRAAFAPLSDTIGHGRAVQAIALDEASGRQPLLPAAGACATAGTAAPSDHRGDDAQPTVTISTRGAFDLMNSLFSEDLPHQQARRALAPVHPPVHADAAVVPQQQPSMQPVMTAASSWQNAPQSADPLSHSMPQQPAPVPEPTVTLNTRLAFDALNDMFNDTLPHEAARKLARRAAAENTGAMTTKPITNSDVRRLANAGRGLAGASLGAGTGGPSCGAPVAPAPGGGAGCGPSSLAIHEDTFFLGPAAALAHTAAAAGPCGPLGGFRGPAGDGPSQGNAHAAAAVAAIYEDTEFMPRAPACRGGAAGPTGAGGAMGGQQGAAPFIMEDTEFMTRHTHNLAAAAGRPSGSRPHAEGMAAPPGGASSRGLGPGAAYGAAGQGLSSRAPRPAVSMRDSAAAGAGARPGAVAQQQSRSKAPLQIYEDTQYLG